MRKNKGITLIALVITIIVLLILAAVSIATLTGENGILTQANKAKNKTEQAREKEQIELAYMAVKSKKMEIGDNTKISAEDLKEEFKNDGIEAQATDGEEGKIKVIFPKTENEYEIDENGEVGEKVIVKREGLKVGDYIEYEPDVVTESYSKLTKENTGYEGTEQQEMKQEGINWRILNIYEDGSLDIIGDMSTNTVYLSGALGYNNGVYLLNDLCKTLYSRKEEEIYARSVNLNDLEKWLTEDGEDGTPGGKTERNNYVNDDVQYGKTKKYVESKNYYPDIYQYENGSGIGIEKPEDIKENGINNSEMPQEYKNNKGEYLTTNTRKEATSDNGMTITQTVYVISINDTNYGEASTLLSTQTSEKSYWLASRFSRCCSSWAGFGLSCVNDTMSFYYLFDSYDLPWTSNFCVRPVVKLSSEVQIKASTGENGVTNKHTIISYK